MAATLRARYTTDDVSDTTPTWIDATSKVRAFSTSRGRDSELGRVEAGTATILLDNRTRTFDPTFNALIRPGNRWWLEDTVTTQTVFLGYAEAYVQGWPAAGRGDAFCEVRLVDEMKVLALARLPVMDPPVDTYADVVMSDGPQGYWRMQEDDNLDLRIMTPTVGPTSLGTGTISRFSTALVGDAEVDIVGGTSYGARSTTAFFYSIDNSTLLAALDVGAPGDASGSSAFTYEQWFNSSEATPAAERIIAEGPWHDADSGPTWALALTTTGKIRGYVYNTTPTLQTITGVTSISASTWYHIALSYDGTFVRVFLNGVQDNSGGLTGNVRGRGTVNQYLSLGRGTPGGTRGYDEVAFYRYSVDITRLAAHYTAGISRGFQAQDPGNRINSVITAGGTTGGTGGTIQTGTREMPPAFMHGQGVLEELRKCEDAESVDAVLFISKEGAITFLADGHRSGAPWNTVQATFDDDGTDLEYTDISVDYSDSWIFNEVQVTRERGTLDTSTDATSVSAYGKRPLQITGLPLTTDSDVTAIGDALLAKYKDPLFRITSLTVNTNRQAVATAVLALDIGARIRVFRTQLTGGRIDQTLFVQKIEVSATPGRPWTIRLGVSPL